MNKKFMCAELQADENGYFTVFRKVECNFWPPNKEIPKEPHDWREAARSAASYEGVSLEESDLVDVKGYIAFKIRTSIFFENTTILNNLNLGQQLPEGYVVVGKPDGYPLIVCWEEEF